MRLAIISTAGNDWAGTAAFAESLSVSLAGFPGLEPSLWLVDDGQQSRPWNSIAPNAGRVHVIELQGRHSPNRALSTALAYLVCERDEQFDAFLLLGRDNAPASRHVSALLEHALLRPDLVLFAKSDSRGQPWTNRLSLRALALLTRVLTGEKLENSSLTFLPLRAAETLAHSCRAGSHLEAAVRQLGISHASNGAARAPAPGASPLSALEELSVFRERVFSRVFGFSVILLCLSLLAALAGTAAAIATPYAAPALLLWLLPPLFAMLAAVSLLLGLAAQALNESRRWTPALDCTLLLRSVKRVKRGPEAIENGPLPENRSAASFSPQWRDPLALHPPQMRI